MKYLWFLLAALGAALVGAAVSAATPAEVAAAIDRHIVAGWEKAKVTPAPRADDAEFLRRVYLDLTGHIPRESEARAFLDDTHPDKRRRLVERLLGNDKNNPYVYANHFTNVWGALLLPEASTNLQVRFQLQSFQAWLRNHLAGNTGYDKMVRELITAPIGGAPNRGNLIAGGSDPSPSAFYFAKELMPENLAAAASRVFLGVKLECAQCHDHPFATWKRDNFWSLAAFFGGVRRDGRGDFAVPGREDPRTREIAIPNTDRKAKARFLDGKEPEWKAGVNSREVLAEWMTRPDNPYFARATVNRLWAQFFGAGLIDPVDEMVGAESTGHYPELLNDLAKAFADANFDLKFLIQAIVLSKPYQLSSRAPGASQDDLHLFARMPLRGLTPEQLFDSVALATSFKDSSPNVPVGVVLAGQNNPRGEFLSRFGTASEKPTDHQTSILHALTLMNGRLVADATSLERSELLQGILDAPFMNTARKIETLYLAALSRRPTEKETARLTKFIDDHQNGATTDAERFKRSQESLADVFWTLLNSGEFMLNH